MKHFLLVVCCLAICNNSLAQIAKLPANKEPTDNNMWGNMFTKWWFSLSSTQVKQRVLSEQGWIFEGPNTEPGAEGTTLTTAQALSTHGKIVLMFSFADNTLYRRAFVYPSNNTSYVAEWNAYLSTLPFDDEESQWLDEAHLASIQRQYVGDEYVMFVIQMYSPKKD